MTIGESIKKLRKDNKLNQTEFAAKIGASRVTVTRIETGKNWPSNNIIESICVNFGVDFNCSFEKFDGHGIVLMDSCDNCHWKESCETRLKYSYKYCIRWKAKK